MRDFLLETLVSEILRDPSKHGIVVHGLNLDQIHRAALKALTKITETSERSEEDVEAALDYLVQGHKVSKWVKGTEPLYFPIME